MSLEESINRLKGNPGVFIPLTALPDLEKNLSEEDQVNLQSAVSALSKKHFFLGEFLFQAKDVVPDEVKNHIDGFNIIKSIMQKYGFGVGEAQNYNYGAELDSEHQRDLANMPGTGRRDVIRAYLLGHFGSDELIEKLDFDKPAHPSGQNLSITFNLQAELQEHFDKNELSADRLSQVLCTPLKRIMTRSYLQETRSKIKTDEAAEKFGSDELCHFDYKDGALTVRIPLSQTFKGYIEDGHMDMDKVSDLIAKDVRFGLHYALHVH